ncbi:hypothetical protein FH972_025576 [Carpinus fangiana]|uniref:UTP23 sensor motif region domain-containing protein n=1 Tax=Carpinus fangiana TaxID=176857 RepID=A0A5N6L404_9ROSI|nr:hypothetical protein FH972_025576 [Carpinus fangiana]
MDFVSMLEKTLHGQVKPMITQCSMRHLYTAEPKNEMLIGHAKGFERRRCGHHELEKPLSTLECFQSVVDPKGSKTNKHRYVVASQDDDVRAYLRTIPGVPMIYLKRSVMIMEPMAGTTEKVLEREEKDKFRSGLKGQRNPGRGDKKRGREDEENDELVEVDGVVGPASSMKNDIPVQKKRKKGPSGPNPLSVRKRKPDADTRPTRTHAKPTNDATGDVAAKKRKRRHKPGKENEASTAAETST